MTKAKHVFGPLRFHMWQVTVLGVPVRSGVNFPTVEEAAFSCQLFKHYLRQEFRFQFEPSLDGDVFATLAYRLNVSLPDSHSVFSALPESAQLFIGEHNEKLAKHRDSIPVSAAEKFRRSGMMDDPAIREWVQKCEVAEVLAEEYASVNGESVFLRLSTVDKSLDASLKSLALAVRLHGEPVPAALTLRVTDLRRLIEHLMETQDYVRELTTRLKREEHDANTALSLLEANRPAITPFVPPLGMTKEEWDATP